MKQFLPRAVITAEHATFVCLRVIVATLARGAICAYLQNYRCAVFHQVGYVFVEESRGLA